MRIHSEIFFRLGSASTRCCRFLVCDVKFIFICGSGLLFQIVKEIVQPRFEAKLIDWATRLTDQHKKVSLDCSCLLK